MGGGQSGGGQKQGSPCRDVQEYVWLGGRWEAGKVRGRRWGTFITRMLGPWGLGLGQAGSWL